MWDAAAGGGAPTGGSNGAADGLAIKCHLPQVDEISSIELDVSVEAVELVVPGVCALSVQLPHKVTLPPISAICQHERRILSLLVLTPTSDDKCLVRIGQEDRAEIDHKLDAWIEAYQTAPRNSHAGSSGRLCEEDTQRRKYRGHVSIRTYTRESCTFLA